MLAPIEKIFEPKFAEIVIWLFDEGLLSKWSYGGSPGPHSWKTVTDNGVLIRTWRSNQFGAEEIKETYQLRPAEVSARDWHFMNIDAHRKVRDAKEGSVWIRPVKGFMKLGWGVFEKGGWISIHDGFPHFGPWG